mgnify:CR=1 FL=1
MKRNDYKPLGDYIALVNERNRDLAITHLVGVSIEKKFIPSIANIIGTDLSPYKIIRHNQFAYGPVTSRNGDKITIALYKDTEDGILSQAYEVFRIKDEKVLMPEYLMLWVQRPEFDRYARFKSHGSVREIFSWEEMCNVMLPVPPIAEQRKIVEQYQTIERRIKNNEALIQKLEATAQALYHRTFVEGIDKKNLPEGWRMGRLKDIASICSGKDHQNLSNGAHPVYGSGGLMRYCNQFLYEGESVLIPRKGTLNNVMYRNEAFWTVDTMFYTKMNVENVALFLFFTVDKIDFMSQDSGTTVPSNTTKAIENIKIIIPKGEVLKSFDFKCKKIMKYIDDITKENIACKKVHEILICETI